MWSVRVDTLLVLAVILWFVGGAFVGGFRVDAFRAWKAAFGGANAFWLSGDVGGRTAYGASAVDGGQYNRTAFVTVWFVRGDYSDLRF